MGQKIHPTGFRLPQVTRNWASRWYANNQNFATMLAEENLWVREVLKAKLKNAAVRASRSSALPKNARITIYSMLSGRRDRQEGRGHPREPQGRTHQASGRARRRQHRRNPQAGSRCS